MQALIPTTVFTNIFEAKVIHLLHMSTFLYNMQLPGCLFLRHIWSSYYEELYRIVRDKAELIPFLKNVILATKILIEKCMSVPPPIPLIQFPKK